MKKLLILCVSLLVTMSLSVGCAILGGGTSSQPESSYSSSETQGNSSNGTPDSSSIETPGNSSSVNSEWEVDSSEKWTSNH